MKIKLDQKGFSLVVGLFVFSSLSFSRVSQSAQIPGSEFSTKIFRTITRSKESENCVISPYALSSALGLAGFGARGNTARQLGKVQPWTLRPEAFTKLWVANRLWVQKDYHLSKFFLEGSDRNFDVRPWMVDFTKAPDFLRDRVNGWMEEKTNSKIKEFLTLDSIDSSMKMLLTSAIYLRADWAFPFDRGATREENFTESSGKTEKIHFMRMSGNFRHGKYNDFQILELPYTEKDLVLDILLPDSYRGLESVEEALSNNGIDPLLADLAPAELNVVLPRFEVGATLDLTEGLKAVGVTDAFSPGLADFSGMTGKLGLELSKMYQRAVVSVTESGTTGSAGNFLLRRPASTQDGLSFHADHPFVFIIWNKVTKVVLFLGHVVKPNG